MSKCILVVDDELEFIELLQYRLQPCDYKIVTATNSTDALNQTWEHTPDVILTDLLLPDLDGLTLCEILQRQEATRKIPIIMISALGSDVTRYSAQIAGVMEFFNKPVNFEKLKETIQSLLQQKARS
jgi:two-component system, OmpR family, alkaline phosphatase synthesis response regulator PhoP